MLGILEILIIAGLIVMAALVYTFIRVFARGRK